MIMKFSQQKNPFQLNIKSFNKASIDPASYGFSFATGTTKLPLKILMKTKLALVTKVFLLMSCSSKLYIFRRQVKQTLYPLTNAQCTSIWPFKIFDSRVTYKSFVE